MNRQSIIWQILNGEEGMNSTKLSEREEELLSIVIKHDNEIKNKLSFSEELSALYEKMNDAIDDLHYEETNSNFIYGFKLGVLLGLEIKEL